MPTGELCVNVSAGAPEHRKFVAAGGDAGWRRGHLRTVRAHPGPGMSTVPMSTVPLC